MNTPRIAIYVRVSTAEQSYALQESELRTYIESRGWGPPLVYADKATGTHNNRPELRRLIQDARQRRFDTVIVWKLDRFARSLKDLILMLQELTELGIDFISLKDQLDLTTSLGRLTLHLLGAFAQFEADIIKDRVRAGISNAKRRGRRFGRPRTINRYSVEQLRAQGLSLAAIAKELGISKAGVYKVLKHTAPQVSETQEAQ